MVFCNKPKTVKTIANAFAHYGNFLGKHYCISLFLFLILPLAILAVMAAGITNGLKRHSNSDLSLWKTPQFEQNKIMERQTSEWFKTLPTSCTCQGSPEVNCNETVPPQCLVDIDDVENYLDCNRLLILIFSNNGQSLTTAEMRADLITLDIETMMQFQTQDMDGNGRMLYYKHQDVEWSDEDSELCLTRADGTCVHFSMITGVRPAIPKIMARTIADQDRLFKEMLDDRETLVALITSGQGDASYFPFEDGQFVGRLYGQVTYKRPRNESWWMNVKSGEVDKIKAMQMFYCLNPDMVDQTKVFSRRLKDYLENKFNRRGSNISVLVTSSWSVEDSNEKAIGELLGILIITVPVSIGVGFLFAFFTGNCRTAKPWFNVIGIII